MIKRTLSVFMIIVSVLTIAACNDSSVGVFYGLSKEEKVRDYSLPNKCTSEDMIKTGGYLYTAAGSIYRKLAEGGELDWHKISSPDGYHYTNQIGLFNSDIYIVSSGELMSLYAANNIAKGVKRFAMRGGVRLGGIIGNSRNTPNEQNLLEEFAKRLNTKLVAFIPRDVIVNKAENNRQTVLQYAPEDKQADVYRALAQKMLNNDDMSIPTPMSFEELEELVAKYGN